MYELKYTVVADATIKILRERAFSAYQHRKKIKSNKSSKNKFSKQEGLYKQVRKTLLLLSNNPRHPGLKTHEYSGITNPINEKHKVFEAYVQNKTPGAYRVFWCYGPEKEQITIITITPHP